MKRPQIEEIDATAVIDPSWDRMPRIEKPPKPAGPLSSSPTPYASYGSTPRRVMIRHPFEIRQDQLDDLRRFGDEDKRRGGRGSMSEMVRDVLDQFIAAKKKEGVE